MPGTVEPTDLFEVAITLPSGPCNCYRWDTEAGALRLAQVRRDIPAAANRGIVVGSLGSDGLPVPVFIVSAVPLCPDARLEARIVGGLLVDDVAAGDQLRAVAVCAADGAMADLREADQLPIATRTGLVDLVAAPGRGVAWVNAAAAARGIAAARRRARRAHVGVPEEGARNPVGWSRQEEFEAALLSEQDLRQVPYRFRRYIAGLVSPGERLLAAAYRPRGQGGILARLREGETLDGLVVVTDRQVAFLEDVLPPDRSLIVWGYVVWITAVERVAAAEMSVAGRAARLRIEALAIGGRRAIEVPFPPGLAMRAEHVAALLRRFACTSGQMPLRRTYEHLVAGSLAEGNLAADGTAVPSPPAWYTPPEDACGTPLAVAPLLPCALLGGTEGIAVLDSGALTFAGRPASGNPPRMWAVPIPALSAVELRHSHLGSWLRVTAPGQARPTQQVPFGVGGERPFLRLVLLLRQLMGRPLPPAGAHVA